MTTQPNIPSEPPHWRMILTIYPDALNLPEFIGVEVDTFTTNAEGETPYRVYSLRYGAASRILETLVPRMRSEVLRALADLLAVHEPLTLF